MALCIILWYFSIDAFKTSEIQLQRTQVVAHLKRMGLHDFGIFLRLAGISEIDNLVYLHLLYTVPNFRDSFGKIRAQIFISWPYLAKPNQS